MAAPLPKMTRTVILFCGQRTGSHYLKDRLMANPGIRSSPELLLDHRRLEKGAGPFREVVAAEGPFWAWYLERIRANPEEGYPDRRIPLFIEYLARLESHFPDEILVHDLKYNTIRSLGSYHDEDYASSAFINGIMPTGVGALHLLRRNTLEIHLSRLLAQESGLWHDYDFRGRKVRQNVSRGRITVPVKQLISSLENIERSSAGYSRQLGYYPKTCTIFYEDITSPGIDNPETRQKAETELRRCFQQPVTLHNEGEFSFRKVSRERTHDAVANWPEVEAALRGTPFEWMLNRCLSAPR